MLIILVQRLHSIITYVRCYVENEIKMQSEFIADNGCDWGTENGFTFEGRKTKK